MAAILPGYTYDIFISYRQKDNKHDGWVTEFVDHLKHELESTFKEDISVYFDENPVDGLMETHIVDKSLEDKLKCLIFIPIISRTYCDPGCYAWQHEFKAFNQLANNDHFRRDIKLPNGNVSSRILPVKIHDIDIEDRMLLETELGNSFRAIDFTYNSSGVNRSLRPNDERNANLNQIYYRDQINKTANSIKEIIQAMKKPGQIMGAGGSHMNGGTLPDQKKAAKAKSIAILPFTDMSPTHDQEYLGDGLAEELLTILSQFKELKVTGRTSSFSFKNKNNDLKTIGSILNVENILEGSIQKSGNRIRITAQLINATDGYQIWSQRYDHDMDDIFALQDDICARIAEHLKLTLLQDHMSAVEKRSTNDIKAYELYLKGDFYYKKYSREGFEKAIECFKKALELDPNFTDAWWYLGYVYFETHGWLVIKPDRLKLVIDCARKAISIDQDCADAHFLMALVNYSCTYDWDLVKTEIDLGNKYLRTGFPVMFLPLEAWYRLTLFGDTDFALKHMQQGVEADPLSTYYLFHLSQIYLYGIRDFKKSISILNKLLEMGFPQATTWRTFCHAYLFDEKYEQALEYARKEFEASEGKGHGPACLIMCLAALGQMEEARNLYQSVLETLSFVEFPEMLHVKVNAFMGNIDKAFEYLDMAIESRTYWLFTLKCSP